MREKDSEFINCRALIFVAVAFFCAIVGVAKTTNGGVSGKVLYANDSLYVEVSNNSNDTVYVFDTYLKNTMGIVWQMPNTYADITITQIDLPYRFCR